MLLWAIEKEVQMRKLATIRCIDEIRPIPDADKICAYRVDGWWVVDTINKYIVGDWVVYCEPDSWIPHSLAPFLSKGQQPREFEGIKGERLRTVKLRGTLSQGLLLPVECDYEHDIDDPEYKRVINFVSHNGQYIKVNEGDDVTEFLGIQLWSAPIPAQLAGMVKGSFPSFIPKTDEPRIQNLVPELATWVENGLHWEKTEKLDGTSMTVYFHNGVFGVCGRNWELIETDTNSLWRVARAADLESKMRAFGRSLAIQMELVGEGIQGNSYKLKGLRFYVFNIYDINSGRYLNSSDRLSIVTNFEINHAPVEGCVLLAAESTVGSLLLDAEGKSELCSSTEREGFVYKCIEDPNISFKCISNKFLLKTGG